MLFDYAITATKVHPEFAAFDTPKWCRVSGSMYAVESAHLMAHSDEYKDVRLLILPRNPGTIDWPTAEVIKIAAIDIDRESMPTKRHVDKARRTIEQAERLRAIHQ